MATEVIAIPEQYLEDVVAVLRAGIAVVKVPEEVFERLTEWCEDTEDYLAVLATDLSDTVPWEEV